MSNASFVSPALPQFSLLAQYGKTGFFICTWREPENDGNQMPNKWSSFFRCEYALALGTVQWKSLYNDTSCIALQWIHSIITPMVSRYSLLSYIHILPYLVLLLLSAHQFESCDLLNTMHVTTSMLEFCCKHTVFQA